MRKLLSSLTLLLVLLSGCLAAAVVAGAGAAAGVILYEANEAHADYAADLPETWQAAIASMQANGYSVDANKQHGPSDGELETDDVWVRVEKHRGGLTRVRVRVGTFRTDDHKRKAKLILEGVQERLAA